MSQSETRGGEGAKRPPGKSWDAQELANDAEAPASRVPLHEALEMPDAVDLARPALASEAPPHELASDLTGLRGPRAMPSEIPHAAVSRLGRSGRDIKFHPSRHTGGSPGGI